MRTYLVNAYYPNEALLPDDWEYPAGCLGHQEPDAGGLTLEIKLEADTYLEALALAQTVFEEVTSSVPKQIEILTDYSQ